MKLFACIPLAAVFCTFAIWWNYASIAWSYPRYKTAARHWVWRHFADPFDWQRIRIAGVFATDCSTNISDESTMQNCIAAAIKRHRGFQARGRYCGIDSCGVTGVVGAPDGTVYSVTFDAWHDNVLLERRRCPAPLQIARESAFRGYVVDCLPTVGPAGEVEVLRDDWAEHRKNLEKAFK